MREHVWWGNDRCDCEYPNDHIMAYLAELCDADDASTREHHDYDRHKKRTRYVSDD